ncbi:unnamed protein product [Bemisia tabaci]|uniref:Protein sleepless n=1 Tax=Bemisia tabaci TaxID=7038 RepID=A0A9P0A6K1_BEMTA|nr:PREDICTED: uncharacterized protein LOC109039801 isoform X2 [Bemisia tabaci]CAH0385656.1 unnamed protein product [Bemisia tabaci]
MKLHLLVLSLTVYIRVGHCIDCYQCRSTDLTNPYQCNEFIDEDDINIKAEPCSSVYKAAYCIKHTGRFEGGLGTKRFCSALDLGNYCNYIQQPGDKLEYRSCVYTCSSDGCNSSVLIKPVFTSLLLSFMILFFISR